MKDKAGIDWCSDGAIELLEDWKFLKSLSPADIKHYCYNININRRRL